MIKKTIQKEKKPAIKKEKKAEKPLIEKTPILKQEKTKKEKYFESVGRRKTSIARVRLFVQKEKLSLERPAQESCSVEDCFLINEKDFNIYFPTIDLQQTVLAPLTLMNCPEQFKVSVRVRGGGVSSQAEAVRHGISRALVLFNSNFRKRLKKAGYLKRDPRMRERKKFGLRRARRAPQWQKR